MNITFFKNKRNRFACTLDNQRRLTFTAFASRKMILENFHYVKFGVSKEYPNDVFMVIADTKDNYCFNICKTGDAHYVANVIFDHPDFEQTLGKTVFDISTTESPFTFKLSKESL